MKSKFLELSFIKSKCICLVLVNLIFSSYTLGDWIKISEQGIGGEKDIKFANANTGWIIGNNSSIKKTTNGGINWFSQSSGISETLYEIAVVDYNNVYISADYGILKTTNGGTEWTYISHGLFFPNGIDVLEETVICSGMNSIAKSTNGGLNWTINNETSLSYTMLTSVEIVNQNEIFLCGDFDISSSKILKSTNGGINFNIVFTSSSSPDYGMNDIVFLNPQKGFVCGNNKKIYFTLNGGAVWDSVNFSNHFNIAKWNRLSFFNNLYGYAAGLNNIYGITTNGGITWETYRLTDGSSSIHFSGISPIDMTNTLFQSSTGRTYKMTNGGYKAEWVRRHNQTAENSNASDMIKDNSGKIIIAGGTGISQDSIFIDKVDTNGNKVWSTRCSEPGYSNSIARDNSDNIIITGVTSDFSKDYVTAKFNSSGVQQWMIRYNSPSSLFDASTSVTSDAGGNVYVTGMTTTNIVSGAFSTTTIKYNSSGAQQWIQNYSTSATGPLYFADRKIYCALDASNNVYVSGIKGYNPNEKVFLIKYNSSGVQQWVQIYNDFTDLADVKVDASGNTYIAGRKGYSGSDFLTVKYNTSGSLQWAKIYNGVSNGSEMVAALEIDASENVFVAGPDNPGFTLIKYNSSGNQVFLKNISLGLYGHVPKGISINQSGEVFVASTIDEGINIRIGVVKYSSGGDTIFKDVYSPESSVMFAKKCVSVGNSFYTVGVNSNYGLIKYGKTNLITPPAPKVVNVKVIQEGFYNAAANKTIRKDTLRAYLRSLNSPYTIIDSASAYADSSSFLGIFNFYNAQEGTYYLSMKHRNSIETWSKSSGISISNVPVNYDFIASADQAFGSNQKLVDNSSVLFAIYGGDVNQDGSVDLTDLTAIDNDAINFVFGYVSSDVNGDGTVDLSDLTITDNNSFNYVAMVRP